MLARCFQHETDHLDGILYTDRLEGEDRKAALRAIRNANYDAITERTTAQARRRRSGRSFGGVQLRRSTPVRVLFAGTPAVAVRPGRPGRRRLRRRRRPHPPGRADGTQTGPDAVARCRPRRRARHRDHPRRQGGCRRHRPDRRRRAGRRGHRRLRRPDSPRRPGCSPPRLDQPALLPAARLARRRPGAALPSSPATTSPAPSPSCLEEGLDTGPVFGTLTETVRPDDTAGALLERLSHSGAVLLAQTLSAVDAGKAVAAAAAGRRHPGPQADPRRRPARLAAARPGHRPAGPRRHARSPAPGPCSTASGSNSNRCCSAPGVRRAPARAAGPGREERAGGNRLAPGGTDPGPARGQENDGRRRLGARTGSLESVVFE